MLGKPVASPTSACFSSHVGSAIGLGFLADGAIRMIEAEGKAEEDFAAALAAQVPGGFVTEQTDGWVAFEISSAAGEGPIRRLMEKVVNVDVAGFAPGCATRTGLEHMSVFLIRRAEDRLAIIGMRTLAASLWHALETAATRLQDHSAA